MATIYYDLHWSVAPSINSIRVRRRLVKFTPKEKFVCSKDNIRILESVLLGTHEIPDSVPRTKYTEIIYRSWHGGGMQQDDINCHSETQEERVRYDQGALTQFAETVVSQYTIPT